MRDWGVTGSERPFFMPGNRGWGKDLPIRAFWVGLSVGECIYMPSEQPKEPWNDSKQAALERAYIKSGRADPCHPMHGSYTGLKARYFGWNVS